MYRSSSSIGNTIGHLYIADPLNSRIRMYDSQTKLLHNFAGTGQRTFSDSDYIQATAAHLFVSTVSVAPYFFAKINSFVMHANFGVCLSVWCAGAIYQSLSSSFAFDFHRLLMASGVTIPAMFTSQTHIIT